MCRPATIFILLFMVLVSSGCPGSGRSFNAKSKITIKVVDEHNAPLEGINVGITFEKISYGKSVNTTFNKLTDINGKCTAAGISDDTVRYGIIKHGYYDSFSEYQFKKKISGRWEPYNPEVVIVLKKIESPVPMYARQAEIVIPKLDKEIGFDLIEYDWVKPYGKGKRSDFVFKVTRKYVNRLEFDGKLSILVLGKYNGIQAHKEARRYGSTFKLPRFAPETGYEKAIGKMITAFPGKSITSDSMEDNNYFFRIRAEQTRGKLHRAMYGKIQGDFNFHVGEMNRAWIGFRYYLNPDYSRNLEFDPKRNLFTNLESLEQVGL